MCRHDYIVFHTLQATATFIGEDDNDVGSECTPVSSPSSSSSSSSLSRAKPSHPGCSSSTTIQLTTTYAIISKQDEGAAAGGRELFLAWEAWTSHPSISVFSFSADLALNYSPGQYLGVRCMCRLCMQSAWRHTNEMKYRQMMMMMLPLLTVPATRKRRRRTISSSSSPYCGQTDWRGMN